jgi:hypothetical protein
MRRAAAALTVFLGCAALFGQNEPEKIYKVSGVGAYPVSDALTSMWLAAPGGRPLIVVFFHGAPGWHKAEWKTASHFAKGEPGWAEFTSVRGRQRVWLNADTGNAEIQAQRVHISDANTYVVVHMSEDPALQKVVPLGTFDLPRSGSEPASVILLHEHPELVDKISRASDGTGG